MTVCAPPVVSTAQAIRLQWYECLKALMAAPHCAASLGGVSPSPILHMVLHDALKDAAKAANASGVQVLLEGGVPPERPRFCPPPPAAGGVYGTVPPLIALVGGTKAMQMQPGDADRGADGALELIAKRRVAAVKLLLDAGADKTVSDANGCVGCYECQLGSSSWMDGWCYHAQHFAAVFLA